MTLPQFQPDVDKAIAVAVDADRAGLDGVFVFDHMWPIGRPDRDVLECFALLGALAQQTSSVRLGPLVARVGLVPDAVLVHKLESLHRMVGHRLIAALGSGDRLSAAENLAYGIEYAPAAERLAAVQVVCRTLKQAGVETWVGGRSAAVRQVAAGSADALNVWDATPEQVRDEGADVPRITWGAQVDLTAETRDAVVERLRAVESAGADFAICSPINTPWDVAVKTLSEIRHLVH